MKLQTMLLKIALWEWEGRVVDLLPNALLKVRTCSFYSALL